MSSIRCRIGGKRARPMASFVGSFRIFRWGAVRVVKMATGVLARNLSTTFVQSVIAGAMSTARANIIVCKSARVGRLRAMACASMPRPTTRFVAPRIRVVGWSVAAITKRVVRGRRVSMASAKTRRVRSGRRGVPMASFMCARSMETRRSGWRRWRAKTIRVMPRIRDVRVNRRAISMARA